MGASAGKQNSETHQMSAEEREKIFTGAMNLLGSSIPTGGYRAQYEDPGKFREANYTAPTAFGDASYQGGTYREAPQAQTLSGGDYDRLEQNIIASRMAPITRQMALDREATDQSLANRGLYSSGLAIRAQNDLSERYAPTIAAAGADAANQRYNLQSGELQAGNQYNLANTQGANQFNQGDTSGRNAFTLARAGGMDAATQDRNAFELQNAQGGNTYGLQRAAGANAFRLQDTQDTNDAAWRKADYLQGLYNQTGGAVSSSSGRTMAGNI